jgi:1-acyl-sn-glycerol-3-phosphate acyltransferase
MTLGYRIVRLLVRAGVLSWIRVEVTGLENVPPRGGCVLVPNHQSVLDPLLVQGVCRREVATMTKSTQFGTPFFRWILKICRAFPVRRYRVDPQSVRLLLRHLEAGDAVCVYPEGERSWDGRLQPLRRGTIRVLLRTGVPVIPVGIEGMYDVWPRWSSRPRFFQRVALRFGRPLKLGLHPSRGEREAAYPEAARLLERELRRLSGEGDRERGTPPYSGAPTESATPEKVEGGV